MSQNGSVPRYRLGPRSTRGLIGGWRSGQIACVGAGLLVATGLLRSVGGVFGLVLAVGCTGGSVAIATWPVRGRSVEQWAPTLARYASRQAAEGNYRPWSERSEKIPGTLSRLSMFQLPGDRPVGVVADESLGTWSSVLRVAGDGFALLSAEERAARVAAWSAVLAAVASEGRGLHRLQWIARSYPALLDGPSLDRPSEEGPAVTGYQQLLAEVSPVLWSREVLLAVSVKSTPRRRGVHEADPAASDLGRHLDRLVERLGAAGLTCSAPLSPRELASCLRQFFELGATDMPAIWPWPVGVKERWGTLSTDGTHHASYWIAEWPRADVGADFLLPLLVGGGIRRSVTVTMAPLAPQSAVRRAERERTSGAADAELRRRHGFAMTARARREQEARLQREDELAEGHAGFRYSGYVTVTESTVSRLEDACRRVEQAAAVAQLELRRLYGAQEEGFCCALPIGRGCR
jgi:hypothetical protein